MLPIPSSRGEDNLPLVPMFCGKWCMKANGYFRKRSLVLVWNEIIYSQAIQLASIVGLRPNNFRSNNGLRLHLLPVLVFSTRPRGVSQQTTALVLKLCHLSFDEQVLISKWCPWFHFDGLPSFPFDIRLTWNWSKGTSTSTCCIRKEIHASEMEGNRYV
jgi:hypothetical protein